MAVAFSISEIREVSEQLSVRTGMPFKHMTHSFLKRRLAMFFDKHSIRKTDDLYERLEQANFVDGLRQFFTIHSTELFRDAGFWRRLRKVFRDNYSIKDYHIWFPAVASGEELYSLLILLAELDDELNIRITVNHESEASLKLIKQGILQHRKMDTNAYNYKRFEGKQNIEQYFDEVEDGIRFKMNPGININFQRGGIDLIPETGNADIIIMRNSLLYFTKDYHEGIKHVIDKSLNKGGYVCLGVKEQLPAPYNDRFECIDHKEKIYSKFSFLRD
jgi:chemotaxis protein methyltransferase CheR